MKRLSLAAVLTLSLNAQWFDHKTPGIPRTPDGKPDLAAPTPKTPDGKPDLSGLWRMRPAANLLNMAGHLAPEEVQPWAAEQHRLNEENLGRESTPVLCLPAGPLYSLTGSPEDEPLRIVQTPGLIVFLYADLTHRQIFLDGRELPENPNPSWMGYSIGRWEGDTLVVESIGFNGRTWVDLEGHPHSENLRMTERLRRLDFGHIDLEVVFSDPDVYARPLTASTQMVGVFDTEMLEYVCAENEQSREHLVGTASDEKTVELSVEILSKYVGDYEMPAEGFPEPPPPIKIALENSTLTLYFGPAAIPMTALSETAFSVFGGQRVEFGKDDGGAVTHLTFRAVEGDFRANRKN